MDASSQAAPVTRTMRPHRNLNAPDTTLNHVPRAGQTIPLWGGVPQAPHKPPDSIEDPGKQSRSAVVKPRGAARSARAPEDASGGLSWGALVRHEGVAAGSRASVWPRAPDGESIVPCVVGGPAARRDAPGLLSSERRVTLPEPPPPTTTDPPTRTPTESAASVMSSARCNAAQHDCTTSASIEMARLLEQMARRSWLPDLMLSGR